MSIKKLSQLSQRKARLEKQLARANDQYVDQLRKDLTRRKILLGSLMLRDAMLDPALEEQLRNRLDEYLKKSSDRALFGLSIVKEAQS